MTAAEYDELFASVNNAGRWGQDDARGTLNHMTAETRLAAAREIRTGSTVSLSRTLQPGTIPGALEPMQIAPVTADDGDIHWALERLTLVYHGYAFSHVDALSHASFRGRSYNGVRERGRLGVENMADGLVSRGVLVDLPALRGVEYLEPGTAYTPADMEAWEKKTGVTHRPRRRAARAHGPLGAPAGARARRSDEDPGGPAPDDGGWLHARGVALVGDDGANDLAPSVVPGVSHAFHQLAIVAMGMPLLDNMDLDALAADCAEAKRWTFFFVGTPLQHQGRHRVAAERARDVLSQSSSRTTSPAPPCIPWGAAGGRQSGPGAQSAPDKRC
jgi:kynurenine formamidase